MTEEHAEKPESGDTDERVHLSVESAMSLLDVKDGLVHTFQNPGAGMLFGADWTVKRVRECFERNGVELAGVSATSMGHGVAAFDEGWVVFFATKAAH